MPERSNHGRLDWVDAAKGLCIVMVVLMHSTHGVEKAIGAATWLHEVVAWAEPFRMPDFFLISGLFLAARIARPWRSYLDTKVVHFVYFYLLWLHIHFALRVNGVIAEVGVEGALMKYLRCYVEPFSALWFIYLLAVYFVVTKLLAAVPKALVLSAAAAMHVLTPASGIFVVDEFANRFVFFYAGYALAPAIFAFARQIGEWRAASLVALLALWAAINTLGVATGASKWPVADLAFSALGIAAVIGASVLATKSATSTGVHAAIGAALRHCGHHSIVVYLSFSIFMAATRVVLLKLAPGLGGATVALACTAAGLGGALVLHALVRNTRLAFLFERPSWARIAHQPTTAASGLQARLA